METKSQNSIFFVKCKYIFEESSNNFNVSYEKTIFYDFLSENK